MKKIILYGSNGGTALKVIERFIEISGVEADILNVRNITDSFSGSEYDLFLFFASAYGDEEIQEDMENFLIKNTLTLVGKKYILCEIGNYYGYEDFEFGAMKIMKYFVEKKGGMEFYKGCSIDSTPRIDWETLEKWALKVKMKMDSSHV